MNKVIDQATAHFRNQISGEMKSVTVPEWGDSKIFWKSSTTLRDEGKILELSQAGKTVEALVESLILRARNEDGSKMFTFADKMVFLNEVDPKVLIRVVGEMNNVQDLDLDNAEKN
jgi:hypothetical protein